MQTSPQMPGAPTSSPIAPPNHQNPEFYRPARPEEISKYLLLLAVLPARAIMDVTIINQAYAMALDGVELHGLQQATRNILKGCLNHAFMPSPPELRMECERVMQPLRLHRQKHSEDTRLRQENAGASAEISAEARQRMQALWQAVRPQLIVGRREPMADDGIAAARARLAARAEEYGNPAAQTEAAEPGQEP